MRVEKKPTRFETRVSLEREVLSRVNHKLGNQAPLFGMTLTAIEQWYLKAVPSIGGDKARDIYSVLVEIGRRAELLSDQSRDVFSEDESCEPDGHIRMLKLLSEKLA